MADGQDGRLHGMPGVAAPSKISAALELLLDAYRYAIDAKRSHWDFAVEMTRLMEAGLSQSDLEWLRHKGYVRQAWELTLSGQLRQSLDGLFSLTFIHGTRFVLTDEGVRFAEQLLQSRPHPAAGHADGETPQLHEEPRVVQDQVVFHVAVVIVVTEVISQHGVALIAEKRGLAVGCTVLVGRAGDWQSVQNVMTASRADDNPELADGGLVRPYRHRLSETHQALHAA